MKRVKISSGSLFVMPSYRILRHTHEGSEPCAAKQRHGGVGHGGLGRALGCRAWGMGAYDGGPSFGFTSTVNPITHSL